MEMFHAFPWLFYGWTGLSLVRAVLGPHGAAQAAACQSIIYYEATPYWSPPSPV